MCYKSLESTCSSEPHLEFSSKYTSLDTTIIVNRNSYNNIIRKTSISAGKKYKWTYFSDCHIRLLYIRLLPCQTVATSDCCTSDCCHIRLLLHQTCHIRHQSVATSDCCLIRLLIHQTVATPDCCSIRLLLYQTCHIRLLLHQTVAT